MQEITYEKKRFTEEQNHEIFEGIRSWHTDAEIMPGAHHL